MTRIRLRPAGLRHNQRTAGMGEHERVRGRAATDEVLRNVDGVVSLDSDDARSSSLWWREQSASALDTSSGPSAAHQRICAASMPTVSRMSCPSYPQTAPRYS